MDGINPYFIIDQHSLVTNHSNDDFYISCRRSIDIYQDGHTEIKSETNQIKIEDVLDKDTGTYKTKITTLDFLYI